MEEEKRIPDFIVYVFESPKMAAPISELRMDDAMLSLVIDEIIYGDNEV